MPRITITSVYVDDQERAREFYTDILGFEVKHDIAMGGGARWLTVVSPQDPGGTELLLEPKGHPAADVFTKALVADGLPLTYFSVDDVAASHADLVAKGVRFTQEPTDIGPAIICVLDDTVGNLIMLQELKPSAP